MYYDSIRISGTEIIIELYDGERKISMSPILIQGAKIIIKDLTNAISYIENYKQNIDKERVLLLRKQIQTLEDELNTLQKKSV